MPWLGAGEGLDAALSGESLVTGDVPGSPLLEVFRVFDDSGAVGRKVKGECDLRAIDDDGRSRG